MAWIPLASSGLAYEFFAFDQNTGGHTPGLPVDVTFNTADSVISLARVEPTYSYAEWRLSFPGSASVRCRVTTLAYSASITSEDSKSSFAYLTFSGLVEIENSASSVGGIVSEFLPAQFDFETISNEVRPALFNYYSSSNSNDGGITYVGVDGSWQFLIEVWAADPPPPVVDDLNCDCEDDTSGNETLGELRGRLMSRLGYGAQAANPPPGMVVLLNDFLQSAQKALYRRYSALRTERFYSWPLVEGVRRYDFPDNQEACTKRLDPHKVTWVGIELDEIWKPLAEGINPRLYSHDGTHGEPERYEIRQCIEIWPIPDQTRGKLVIKGHFGLEPFAADTDRTTINSELVFLMALSNAKAHYRQPDAGNYMQQMEVMLLDIVAGTHHTARYLPGRNDRTSRVYVVPKPTEPFA